MSDDAQVELDGHLLKLTNLSKVLYPDTGTTKGDVIGYYAGVAHAMIPHVTERPVTRKRWPNGVEVKPFFQKNIDASTPSWVPRRSIEHRSGTNTYPLIDSPATLAWFGQNAALEIHVPQWRFGPHGAIRHPDRLVFDLDPGPGVELAECAEIAVVVRDRLDEAGMPTVPVTSGSKGIHLYTRLDGKLSSQEASDFAHRLAEQLEKELPKQVLSRMTRSLRPGKIFLDWSQNSAAKTTIAPYSLRGREHPMVAAPRTWAEMQDPNLAQLDYREVLRRLADAPDPMANLETGGPVGRARRRSHAPDADVDKLAVYRSKRSADRTPEPVPAQGDPPQDDTDTGTQGTGTFVIQEHHATALHWDFRLERGGVLVSWALPKGIPITTRQNRLAVRTEDHPLDYADFSGRIPSGEYGGGDVAIWDSGRYETEKWRDDEVIVQLHGARAKGRFALIRTKDSQWLIHRTKGQEDLPPVIADDSLKSPAQRRRAGERFEEPSEPAVPEAVADEETGKTSPQPDIPDDLTPMLATAGTVDDLHDDHVWRLEGKWDGVRAIAEIRNGTVRLVSRNKKDMTATYPELAELADWLRGHSAVLDGEIVAVEPDGRTDFSLLQQRMKLTKAAEIARVREHAPVSIFVFDVLHLDGVSLLRKKFDDRRRLLDALGPAGDHVRVPELLSGEIADALAMSRRKRWEGVVAKAAGSIYQPGKRARTWIKIKNFAIQEVVVIGWRPGNGRRSGMVGSLLLGIPSDDGFDYIGRVGTGFTDADLEDVAARLKPLARDRTVVTGPLPRPETRDAQWVRPLLVGEVSFAEWSRDGLLRQASWRGFRPDKDPGDVRRE